MIAPLVDIGKRIQQTRPYELESAIALNEKVSALIGKPNALGLNELGYPEDSGVDLNWHIGAIVRRIGAMQERAIARGMTSGPGFDLACKLADLLEVSP